jgi:hypothetical protein
MKEAAQVTFTFAQRSICLLKEAKGLWRQANNYVFCSRSTGLDCSSAIPPPFHVHAQFLAVNSDLEVKRRVGTRENALDALNS